MAASSTPHQTTNIGFLSIDFNLIPFKDRKPKFLSLKYIYSPFHEFFVSGKMVYGSIFFDIFDGHYDIKEKLLSDDIEKSEKYLIYCDFFKKIGVEHDVFMKYFSNSMDWLIKNFKEFGDEIIKFSPEKLKEIIGNIVKKYTQPNNICYYIVYSDFQYAKNIETIPILNFISDRFKVFDLNMFCDLSNLKFKPERPRNHKFTYMFMDDSFNFVNFFKKFTFLSPKELKFVRKIINENLISISNNDNNNMTVANSGFEFITKFLKILIVKSTNLQPSPIMIIHIITIFMIVINNILRKRTSFA